MEKTIKLRPKILLSPEEAAKKTEEAFMYANIAFVLSDTVHSFYLDACSKFDILGVELKDEDKHNFLELKKSAERAKYFSRQIARSIYKMNEKDTEDALRDADWFYNLVKFIEDRIGEDKLKTHQFLEFLDTMPSEGRFKIGIEDFQRI